MPKMCCCCCCCFYAEFYRVVWTINALLAIHSKILPLAEKKPKHTNVQSPPEHFAIDYVHNDNLPLGNIALQYVIQNNCRKVWWCFLMIFCTFWRSIKKKLNSPKLSCGFNFIKLNVSLIIQCCFLQSMAICFIFERIFMKQMWN